MTPQDRAERSATAMWAGDTASQWIGCTLQSVAPGQATLALTVQAHHLNGHGSCHGGIIFTLADSAFAFACNSYNQIVVGQETQITYLAPGELGEVLTATATESARQGRTGVYDVTVTGGDRRKVALFRGLSRAIKGQHFPEDDT